ncbi:MAG: poly(R)-hydroxyalkanoic acid synthase subunit PhaE [Myxococcota bacterium]
MTTETTQETPPAEELLRRAQEAMLGMFRMAPSMSGQPTAEAVTERFLESQRRAFDMMRGFTSVWTDLAERGVSGPEAWKRVLDDTAKLMGAQAAFGGSSEQLMTAWREQGERMLEMFRPFAAAAQSASPGPFDSEMTAFLSSPSFGMGREYQTQVGHLFEVWLRQKETELQYQQHLNSAWTKAFQQMTERMEVMVREGRRFENPRELMELWVQVGDDVFTDLFHTEAFSKAQAEMLNAAHEVRRGRRDLTEAVLKASDLPTLSDIEVAHRAIYELRREVRALKRELATLREERS